MKSRTVKQLPDCSSPQFQRQLLGSAEQLIRNASMSHDGGSRDILAQRNALTPADTHGAAYA